MKRRSCSACGYDNLEMFLDLGMSPIADDYTDGPRDIPPRHPLQLGYCTGCWLVQLLDVVDHSQLFGAGYSFYSSASPPLSAYHASYASDIIVAEPQGFVVEVGCNDGDMLRHFQAAGYEVLGVDPAIGPAKVAEERGLTIIKQPFNLEVAETIRETYGDAHIIIANHVLAHVEDVGSVVAGIARLLAQDGVAYIEVQYLPDLLVNNAFDLVYHEHRNFFSFSSLESALQLHGLRVDRAELTDRQGGSIRVRATKSAVASKPTRRLRSSESWLHHPHIYAGMQGRVERIRDRLLDILDDAGQVVVGYGAPAKATTLLNFCGIDSTQVQVIRDTTPAKQGRYVPGTGIQIVAPEDAELEYYADSCLLLAWNYMGPIMRAHRSFEGNWIVPIPSPMVL